MPTYQTTVTPNPTNAGSFVTSGRPSMSDCDASMQSNGSLCGLTKQPAS